MANVNVSVDQLLPQSGSDSQGRKMTILSGETKAAQNDTITLSGASSVDYAILSIDATGASETHTISGNVVTLTSATTGTVSGIIVYK